MTQRIRFHLDKRDNVIVEFANHGLIGEGEPEIVHLNSYEEMDNASNYHTTFRDIAVLFYRSSVGSIRQLARELKIIWKNYRK